MNYETLDHLVDFDTLDSIEKEHHDKLKNKIYYLDKSVNSLKLKRPRFLALDVRKVEKKIKDKMITPNASINNLIKEIPK